MNTDKFVKNAVEVRKIMERENRLYKLLIKKEV